ncbi:unnamed protein product [Owenia fusiformis]|uniref:Uncharacterized protein n=1 Tax=Owenia fusiformis TaxID=6347 RepID=A0A8J1Y9E5_OWEFU|nr:unnamed protein product [Owenia fusiformis]
MPVVLLERLPLPSLQTYSSFSVLLLGISLLYSHKLITEPLQLDANGTVIEDVGNITKNRTFGDEGYYSDMMEIMTQELMCIWTLINMAYCCLILIGKGIQRLAFGELRVSEQQHIKDKFWNFVFYKFIFIFGVLNVQDMTEVVYWSAWFSILGFLHLLAQLCKDRFEYLSFSPSTAQWTHVRLLSLLFVIQFTCSCLMLVCVFLGMHLGINTFCFMGAEVVLLMLKTMFVISRYIIHLYDIHLNTVWENRAIYVYYIELIFELGALAIDFAHHLHMLIWGNIFLSMASLVICMQLRYLFHGFQRRIKRHKNYLKVVKTMDSKFPVASADDIQTSGDDCAICWEKMETARKLPCSHLFHTACLRSWLEQDVSCPTCRTNLDDPREQRPLPAGPGGDVDEENVQNVPENQIRNHFFHFDGSRYVSWLPSFSVEVTHNMLGQQGAGALEAPQTSQLDEMGRQVQGVFPDMPLNLILEDLRHSHSVEQTIENILEERVTIPTTLSRTIASTSQATITTAHPLHDNRLSLAPSIAQAVTSSTERKTDNNNSELTVTSESADIASGVTISDTSSDVTDGGGCVTTGGRFSKSSTERETILRNRRNQLVANARRKYLNKHTDIEQPGSSIETQNSEHLEQFPAQRNT